jgi:hypothetical protein
MIMFSDRSHNPALLSAINKFLSRNAYFITALLNIFVFYKGNLLAPVISISLFLLPVEVGKSSYIDSHLSLNHDKYWTNTLLIQSLLSFRHTFFLLFSVIPTQDALKWPVFSFLSLLINPGVVWDVLFLSVDLEQSYAFSPAWLFFESLLLLLLILTALSSFSSSSLLNKHLLPPAFLCALFCKTPSLRLFSLCTGIRLIITLQFSYASH